MILGNAPQFDSQVFDSITLYANREQFYFLNKWDSFWFTIYNFISDLIQNQSDSTNNGIILIQFYSWFIGFWLHSRTILQIQNYLILFAMKFNSILINDLTLYTYKSIPYAIIACFWELWGQTCCTVSINLRIYSNYFNVYFIYVIFLNNKLNII